MVLRSGYLLLAQFLQEAADTAPHSTVMQHLADAVRDAHKGTGSYAHYIDHTGDGTSGDVIYSADGETRSAPYSITSSASKQTATVDTSKATKVIPVVAYKKHVTASESSVSRETSHISAGGPLRIVESAAFTQDLVLNESSRTNYPIKIMSPGAGSSAYYSPSVVERAASLVKPGTLMFWNHQTLAEESQRPEGDLNHLAAIITKQGEYQANGPKGPGIYAEAKVMADYAQKVEERAPHIGLSIRAGGTTTGKLVDGKPELKSIDHIESIDYVTKAGRGGLALVEAAREAGIQVSEGRALKEEQDDMTEDDRKLLREAIRVQTETQARVIATSALSDVSLIEAGKSKVIDLCLRNLPMKDGVLDTAKLTETVKHEAKLEGAYLAALMGTGVRGMGSAPAVVELTEAEREKQEKADKRLREAGVDIFSDLTGNKSAGEYAARGRAA